MQQNFVIQLEKQISNAVISNDISGSAKSCSPNVGQDVFLEQLRQETAQISQQQTQFKNLVDNLAHLQSEFFKQQKENIAKLSVEIARRILGQKIQQDDYEIKEIIKHAIDNAPVTEDIVVRLNPEDYSTIEAILKSSETEFSKGVSFVSDSKIKKAECALETSKGVIESFIDEQLDKITEALKKAE